MAGRSGNAAAGQAARQRQRQLGLRLLLQSLVFSPRSVRHEPGVAGEETAQRLRDERPAVQILTVCYCRARVWKEIYKIGSIPVKRNPYSRVYDG